MRRAGVGEQAAELLRGRRHPGWAAGRETRVGRQSGALGGQGDGTALVEPTGVTSDDRLSGVGHLLAARQTETLPLGNLPHQVDERRADGRLDAAHSSWDDDGLDVRPSNGAPDSPTVPSIARSSHGATRVHPSARAVRTPSAGVRHLTPRENVAGSGAAHPGWYARWKGAALELDFDPALREDRWIEPVALRRIRRVEGHGEYFVFIREAGGTTAQERAAWSARIAPGREDEVPDEGEAVPRLAAFDLSQA